MPTSSYWVVELKGHVFDLQDLETQFKVGAIRVMSREGRYLLRTMALEHLDAEERHAAYERAVRVMSYVNAMMEMLSPAFRAVEVSGVRWIPEDDPRFRFVFAQEEDERVGVRWRASRDWRPSRRGVKEG